MSSIATWRFPPSREVRGGGAGRGPPRAGAGRAARCEASEPLREVVMKVVVIGALGKVARLLVPLLADGEPDDAGQAMEVVGIIRRPEQIDRVGDLGADPLLLDVEQATTEAIAAALDGADAVVWSAGAGGGNPSRTYAVDRDAAMRSMDAAEQAGVRRDRMAWWNGGSPGPRGSPGPGF